MPESGLQAPPNAAELSVDLGGIVVEGDFPEQHEKTRAAAGSLEHRRVTLAQIYAFANALEKVYADAGYPLARVVVPAQKLRPGGQLRLVLIDGVVEAVDVSALPPRQQPLVKARLAPLIGRPHLTLAEIERRLLLAADDPGLTLNSTLTAGKTAGGSLLVLQGAHAFVTGSQGVENYLPPSLGTWSLNTSLAINSVLGLGEQAYFSGHLSPDLAPDFAGSGRVRLLGGGFVLPVGIDGLALNPEFTRGVTRPAPAAGAPPSEGVYDRFDLRALYPVIRSRAHTLVVQGTVEWAQERLTPFGFSTDLYRDRYRTARLQLSDQALLPWGATTQTTLEFSKGLGGRNAAYASGVPLSQFGASPTFEKLTLDARLQEPLPFGGLASFILRGQTSFGKPLFVAEQFSLDGPTAASGFSSGVFNADEGFTARAELGRPITLPVGAFAAAATPYLFGEDGRGFIDRPTAVQAPAFTVASFGLGARFGADAPPSRLGGSVALEAARALTDAPGQRDAYRFNFSAAVRF